MNDYLQQDVGENFEDNNFADKDLRNVDLSEQDLRNTDFRNADLRGANFSKRICKANLQGAILSQANLSLYMPNYKKQICLMPI